MAELSAQRSVMAILLVGSVQVIVSLIGGHVMVHPPFNGLGFVHRNSGFV